MHLKKRLIAVLLLLIMAGTVIYGSTLTMKEDGEESSLSFFSSKKETIYFWYSDEEMTDYINSAAVAFSDKKDVRVIPVLTAQGEFLEAVNQASLHSKQVPDVYLLTNDSLEKAYLAGLASEVRDDASILNAGNFPEAAISAVTYRDKLVAYPYYYETSVLLYNETYIEEWARQQAEKENEPETEELDGNPEENQSAENQPEESQEDVQDPNKSIEEKIEEYKLQAIPLTIDDILNIADTFDVPEGVEGVMKWDVSDIFYNYWVVGNSMIVGGDPGDNENNINIYNEETIESLEVYKALNQFFYIESDTVTYDSVVQDFIDGKLVFTIASTDIVERLAKATEDGSFTYEYGVALVPDINENLESRSVSVTTSVVVNGYSEQKELANEFAAFLVNEYTEGLYERTGKVSSNLKANKDNGPLSIFMIEYAYSIPLPKMIDTSNFWLHLETVFSKVWNGEDVAALLENLSQQIKTQILGSA
ncbi:extracellular solute-binding protein [Lachnospiraceae bacterium OttesenSCG-928-D06]|nr:extracellular solute-binding protein [Lachnospiraceae bacterium OttesenSCG-928-D06]